MNACMEYVYTQQMCVFINIFTNKPLDVYSMHERTWVRFECKIGKNFAGAEITFIFFWEDPRRP